MNFTLRPALLYASLCALPLVLCSCGGKETDQHATAGGEILPGSASDAMLPYDTVRSQPPIVVPTAASGKPGEDAPDDTASEGTVSPEAAASSAPVEAKETTEPAVQ